MAPPTGFLLLCVFASACGAATWSDAHRVPAYADATAGAPRFGDKALWPLQGDEAFAKQEWPAGRVYVWAHPGKSGGPGGGKGQLKVDDPANWLVDGKPAKEVEFGEDADVVLPPSDAFYEVSVSKMPALNTLRHLTVGRNARWGGGGDGQGRRFFGNVWVKRGGRTYGQGATRWEGPGHCFARNDNVEAMPELPYQRWERDPWNKDRDKAFFLRLSQYLSFNKAGDGSIEVLGMVDCLDEFSVNGLVILGRDSRMEPGRNAAPRILSGGTLALMDGAVFGSWTNNLGTPDLDIQGGTLQGGLPGRPLMRDATWRLAVKNHSQAKYPGKLSDNAAMDAKLHGRLLRVPSAVIQAGSTLCSFAAANSPARLVVTWSGSRRIEDLRPEPGMAEERTWKGDASSFAFFDGLPPGIDLWIGPGVTVERVTFDHLRAGGLLMAKPEERGGWKDVVFGPKAIATDADAVTAVADLKSYSGR